MQARLLLNVLLLGVVAVLLVLAFNTTDKNSQKQSTLSHIDPGSISRISISHRERSVLIEKQAGIWRLVTPVAIDANEFRISSLLKILKTRSHASYDAASLDLDKYGLDKHGLEQAGTWIQFDGHSDDGHNENSSASQPESLKIEFGITNPVNQLRYVKIGDRVQLIDDNFYPLLSSQVGTLVSHRLVPAGFEITALVLPEARIEKDDSGKWLSQPELPADALIEILDHWKNSQAFGVHDYVKREALARVELQGPNQSVLHFEITDVDPWLILARPEIGMEYHFDIDFYDRLLRPGAEKQVPADVEQMMLDGSAQGSVNETSNETTIVPLEDFRIRRTPRE